MNRKILLNQCVGEFCLSNAAMHLLASLQSPYVQSAHKGKEDVWYSDIPRDDADLITMVEALGERANGRNAHLVIKEVSIQSTWEIVEQEGMPGYEFLEVVE